MYKNSVGALHLSIFCLFILLTGCGSQPPAVPTQANDLLAKILARGTIIVATDPAYPPQSEHKAGSARAANTKCGPNEYTSAEFAGFDVATTLEIASRLGVEACFVTPQWGQLIAGSWDNRWDISIGSMSITTERLKVLYFSQPYYATPAAVFVHKDNKSYTQPADLSGKRMGACTGCTYDDYLRGVLVIPGTPVDFVIKNAQIVGYDVDVSALQDLAVGDGVNLDGVLVAQPTGLQSSQDGLAIRQLGEPVFFEYLAASVDKKGTFEAFNLAVKVSGIIQQMHADGTLLKLSQQYYNADYTTVAGKFDLRSLEQLP